MNGSFIVIFTYQNKAGSLQLNLNSLSKSKGPNNGKESFDGWGNQGKLRRFIRRV